MRGSAFFVTKRKGIFDVQIDNPFIPKVTTKPKIEKRDGIKIETALNTVIRQLKAGGCRERTIYDYELIVNYFIRDTGIEYLEDITSDSIFSWIYEMDVKPQTKLTRLKCFKAFLGRCFDNGWFKNKFWRNVNIKVNQEIKEGATDDDVNLLLSVLDFNNWLDLRNGVAVLIMYRCGLRLGTIAKMRECHVDFENLQLVLDGEVMKNHKGLILPIDEQLAYLLQVLIQQNQRIREEYKKDNDYLFITVKGNPTNNSITSNSIQKQLRKYTLKYGIKNINPHALRRGFAKNLYDKSNGDILLVSKALGHNDLSVTTKYLHVDLDETARKLRDFL